VGPTPTLNDMSSTDLAWLTGLIEGEGYFGVVRGRGIVRVVMTDADIIERLKTVSGTGTVIQLPQRAEQHKRAYAWTIEREAVVPDLLLATAPWLGTRRRMRVDEILRLRGLGTPAATPLSPGSDEAWNWVSGLIEGEGAFQPGPATKRRGVQVVADSTDKDVIERLAILTGVGTVLNLGSQQAHLKIRYRWSVTRKADVESVLSRIMPMLGTRRTGQASYVLEQM
jgi:hypothetical protein